MKEDPGVHGSRPVKRLSGSRVVHICASVGVCLTIVWILSNANEVRELFDEHSCPLLAPFSLFGQDWAGCKFGWELLHRIVADRQKDGQSEVRPPLLKEGLCCLLSFFFSHLCLSVAFLLWHVGLRLCSETPVFVSHWLQQGSAFPWSSRSARVHQFM